VTEQLHDPRGVYRKLSATVSQRVAKMALADIAKAVGKSDSTACRVRDGEQGITIMECCALLYAAGLKVVDADAKVVDASIYDAACAITAKAMADPEIAQLLLGAK